MELPASIDEWCQYEALGQCLTQWGKETELDYTTVVKLLWEDDVDWSDLYDNHGIMVWTIFEDYEPAWVADQIESLYDSYIKCAEFALKEGK
jgi:hypothetical protein